MYLGFFCAIKNFILDIIAPRQCLNCYKFGSYLCSHCKSKFIHFETEHVCHVCKSETITSALYVHHSCRHLSEIDEVVVCVKYNKLVHDIISEIKYHLYTDVVNLIVELMVSTVDISKFRNCIFVPIPLHKSKQRQRGFNQAELIAIQFTEKLNRAGVECSCLNLIERSKNTLTQVGMSKEDRQQNLKEAFSINPGIQAKINKHLGAIYLLDDVMTTGTTLEECAKVLKQAGFRDIRALVFARG
jgi:competence protein ComFC